MALTVTQRPQAEIYSSTNPDPYEPPLFVSYWNASALPLVYKLESDLFPTNSVDAIDSIGSVENYNGFALINLTGVYSTYELGDYIVITDSSVEAYNGIFQIRYVSDANSYAINSIYQGDATAFAQKYYKNYNAVVRVYAGLPPYHPYSADKPLQLVTTVNVVPDTSNICYLNIQEIVQRFLPFDNELDTNNINAFTGFYIEFAESYYEGGENVVTTYQNDVFAVCDEGQQIINGTFDTNLSGWFQTTDYSKTWVQSSGKAQVTGFGFSQVLYQPISVNNGKSYTLNIDYTKSQIPDTWFYVFGFNSEDISNPLNFAMLYAGLIPLSGSLSKEIIMPQAFEYVGFQVYSRRFGNVVTLDNIEFTLSVLDNCIPVLWASNSAQQFRYRYNGSMGEYMLFPNKINGKFMTGNWTPTLFKDNYLDLSIIIPDGIAESLRDMGGIAKLTKQYDINGNLLTERSEILPYYGGGVYRVTVEPIEDVVGDLSVELRTSPIGEYSLMLNGVNYLKLTYYSALEFQYTDPFTIYWKGTINSLIAGIDLVADNQFSSNGYRFSVLANGRLVLTVRDNSFGLSFAITNQAIPFNEEVEIMVSITTTNTYFYINGVQCTNSTETHNATGTIDYDTNLIIGHVEDDITTESVWHTELKIFSAAITPSEVNDDTNLVLFLPFYEGEGATVTNLYGVGGTINNAQDTDRGDTNTWVWTIDHEPVSDPNAPNDYFEVEDILLSEVKTVKYDPSCYKYPLYITWLNTLGGWDYWLFTAKKDYGIEVDDVVTYERNIFQSFPGNFQNETWEELIGLEARNVMTVRSQPMTREQLLEVSKIVYSKMVQIVDSETSKYTVLIDKRSIDQYTDGDKLHFIEFNISLPRIITQ